MKSDTEGASKERFVIEEGASILLPVNGTVDTLFDRNDGTDDIYAGSELLIAPSNYKRINITGATAITGAPFIDNTLHAGTVSPAEATVTYQWQYADTLKTADGLWTDILAGTEKDFYLNEDIYIGKYLRVKIMGCGKYTGTVYSTLASPVKANGATMVDFIVDGCALGEYSRASTLWLQGDEYPDEVLMTVVAEDPSAQVVIQNVTNDFTTKTEEEKTINGASGMMPFKYAGSSTCNKIKITITSGENTKVYNVSVRKYEPETKVYIQSTTNSTIKIKDLLGNVVDSVSGGDYKHVPVEPGKKYTIEASTTRAGWIVTNLGNEKYDQTATLNEEVRSAVFTVPRGHIEKFYATDILVKAPQVSVSWGPDNNNGCYILAEWETPLPEISTDAGYTGRISAKLYDEDGNPVSVHNKNEDFPEGFYIYFDGIGHIFKVDEEDGQLSLDPTKSYTVKLWYDATNIEQCEMQELTVEPVDLSANNHRVAIARPAEGTAVKTVHIGDKARAFGVKSFPEEDVEEFNAMRSSSEPGSVDLSVSSTARLGTRYVVIYSELDSGEIISDVLIVDVVETSGDVKVSLEETRGTLDIYRNDCVVVPLSISGSTAAVTAVSFVDSSNTALSNKYGFTTNGGMEVTIEPLGIPSPDSGSVDWNGILSAYKGTFKARLKVELTDYSTDPATVSYYTTPEYYSLTISGKAPGATAKAVKLNSFYRGDCGEIEISSKNGRVISAVVDATKTTGKTVACPNWVSVSEGGLMTSLINNELSNNKGTGKIYMNAKIEGYRIPAPVVVAVSAAYTAPKIKLSESTVTVPIEAARYVDSKTLYVMSADKNVSFDGLNITGIRVANKADLIKLGVKEQTQYAISKYFKTDCYDRESGSFVLAKATNITINEFLAGKALLIATIGGNQSQEVLIPLTIKTVNATKATVKMNKGSLTLNPYLDDQTGGVYGVQPMSATVISSIDGIDFDGITWTVTDSKGNGDYRTYLNIEKQSSRGQYSFKTNANTIAGTYKVNFFVPGIVKPATINVVVKGTVPAIKFGAKSATIDQLADYSKGTEWKIPITLSDDSIVRNAASFTYKVTDAKNKTAENVLQATFGYKGDYMSLSPKSEIINGSYNIEVIYTMASGQKSTAKFPVKVVGKAPAIKASRSSVVLNPDLLGQDCATVTFSRPDNCIFNYAGVLVYDNKNQIAADAIDCSFDQDSGVLKLNPRANIVKGATYKVAVTDNFSVYGPNIYTTSYVTVKALTAGSSGKTAITVKTTTKGKIDLSRPDSAMQVINTYNGWNGDTAVAGTSEKPSPLVSWEVYAYDKKNKPYNCGNSGYQYTGTLGLVAQGNSEGYSATTLDWFKDVDVSPYGLSLCLNPDNPGISALTATDGFYDLNYKVVVKTIFGKYYSSTESLVLTSDAKFVLTAGTVKPAAPTPNKVILDSGNKYDSKIVKINLIDKDANEINISEVSACGNPYYDVTLVSVGGGYAYVAIGWKDDLVNINHKNGKLTLAFYAGYNSVERGKKNATTTVTVEAK